MRSKKFRRLVWLGGVYDYTNTKIKGYAPYKGFPKFHGLRYMIGTEDVLSNQYKQAKFQLTNVGFHVSYYADIPVYTCLLYTSPSPRDGLLSRMPSSA